MGRKPRIHLPFCGFLILLFFCLSIYPIVASDEPTIRAGLTTIGSPKTITLRCDKPFDITGSGETPPITVQGQQVALTAGSAGISVSVESGTPATLQGPVRLTPNDPGAIFEIVSPKPKYKLYRGVLELSGKTALRVVNILSLEDYIRGVLPAEVPATFHIEAQKAMAVAIRTYTLTSLGRHKSEGYDVCDTTNCQGYSGASRSAEWVDKVVEETRGQVAVYENEPIHACYSADCGGMTQNNEDAGFGSTPWPYLRAVLDCPPSAVSSQQSAEAEPGASGTCEEGAGAAQPVSETATRDPRLDYCAASPSHTWTKTYTSADMDKLFGKKVGKVQSVEFTDYDATGRTRAVVVKGDKGEQRMHAREFRVLLGPNVLKSTQMTISRSETGDYAIQGRGFGHAVGLCMFGANGLAKAGAGYVDILKHYYTGTEVKGISDCRFQIAD